jgi:threonine/homoserine/homoserine lactone efflux protein
MPLTLMALLGYAAATAPLIALGELAGAYGGEISTALKALAAVVMTLLALRLWANAEPGVSTPRTPSRGSIFLLTLFNPKALIFSFGIMQPVRDLADLSVKSAVLGALIVLSAGCWIAAGAATRKLPAIPGHWITRTSSVVLTCFAAYFLTTAIGEVYLH